MTNKLLAAAFFLLSIISINGQEIRTIEITKSLETEIDLIFERFDDTKTPGISVGFIQNGHLIFSKQYGRANLEHNIAINDSSLFSLASVSKQFTVFAILLLEEQGKLSLEDDIRKYLPTFPDYGEKITIRQLANHTSGIRSQLHLLGQSGYTSDNVITKEDVLNIIYNQSELNFSPGAEFNYSNSGYVLLAEIVENISRKPFSAFMDEYIFTPLQMDDSFVMEDYNELVNNRADSYTYTNGNYVNAPANYSYYGSTGLFSTIGDLSKWANNFSNHRVGSHDIFEKMEQLEVLNDGTTYGYALGQFVGEFNGLKHIYHSGGDAGYRTFLGRFPEQKASVILLSNNGTIDAQGLALQLADMLLKPYKGLTTNEDNNTPQSSLIQLPSESLEKLAGSYLDPNTYIIREIYVRNDTLIYSRKEQNNRKTPLLALNEEYIFQFGSNPNLQAVFKKDNETESISVLDRGKLVEYYEKFLPISYSLQELEEFIGTYYSRDLDTRYKLEMTKEKLSVNHLKMSLITIEPIKSDTFLSSSWQFRSLEFERNQANEIVGFKISSDRAKNVRFEKVCS